MAKFFERILVVDDDEAVRILMTRILNYHGHDVITAVDGQQGLEMALAESPTLVLLDLNMPRMNGLDVLRSLRAKNFAAPVILMTFFGSEEILVQALRLGIRDYLPKPFTPEDLMAAIERAMATQRWSAQKEQLDRQEAALETIRQLVKAATLRGNSPLMALALGLDSLRSQLDARLDLSQEADLDRALALLEAKVHEITAIGHVMEQACALPPGELIERIQGGEVQEYLKRQLSEREEKLPL